GIYGIYPCEHHGLYLLEPPDLFGSRVGSQGNGVAHLYLLCILNAGNNIADIARLHLLPFGHPELEDADLIRSILLAGGHELDQVAFTDRTVHDAIIYDNAPETVVYAVEDQRLERSVRITRGRR